MGIDRAWTHTDEVLTDVAEERIRQDEKFGGPIHDDELGINFFIQSIQDFSGWARQMAAQGRHKDLRERLIQVAALAVAAIESEDRKEKRRKTLMSFKLGANP